MKELLLTFIIFFSFFAVNGFADFSSNNIWDNNVILGDFAGTAREYHGIMILTKNQSRIVNITKHSNTIATECGIFRVYDNVSLENASFVGDVCQFTGNTILDNNVGYRVVIKSTSRGYASYTYPNNTPLDFNIITGVFLSGAGESPPYNWENDSVNIIDIIQITTQTFIPPPPIIIGGTINICLDNNNLQRNVSKNICIGSECLVYNTSENIFCENGCDNITGTCSPPQYQQDLIMIFFLLGIAGLFLWIYNKRRW